MIEYRRVFRIPTSIKHILFFCNKSVDQLISPLTNKTERSVAVFPSPEKGEERGIMKKLVMVIMAIMTMTTLAGCASRNTQALHPAAVSNTTETTADEVASSATVTSTDDISTTLILSGDPPANYIFEDIKSSEYMVWEPGDLPGSRWKRSSERSSEMYITYQTAVVNGDQIVRFGEPDESRTLYLLANSASVKAVRTVCAEAEIKGANRVVVCDNVAYNDDFDEFINILTDYP